MQLQMSLDNNTNEFLTALNKLPLIQGFIRENYHKIINIGAAAKTEKKLIEENISNIMIEFKNLNSHCSEDEELQIKMILRILFEKQLELTKLAEKIRQLKGNPPSAFR